MNDLLNRIAKIEDIMSQPYSNKTKVMKSLQQFSGLGEPYWSPQWKLGVKPAAERRENQTGTLFAAEICEGN